MLIPRPASIWVVLLVLAGCGGMPPELEGPPDGGAVPAGDEPIRDAGDTALPPDAGAGLEPDAGVVADAGPQADAGLPCPAGQRCVTSFPFTDTNDTATSPVRSFSRYDCAPGSDESGAEVIYRVTVPTGGFLSAAVYEQPGVDVDVHLLSALSASACLSRGNLHAGADVAAGTYYVVVDTFVGGSASHAGAFRVDIGFVQPSAGPCVMRTGLMPRVNDNGNSLPMPATGKMAVEAHLVTQAEPPPYPTTARENLAAHNALSQSRTGFVMHRQQAWAPLEGGTFYGAGIGSPTLFPVEHEGWYINMYWRSANRPARGTRMIARAADGSGRAVVVAAGYETGPGDLTWVGGTPEETHFYLGTGHGSLMTIGIADDQSLPLGPRACAP